MAQTKLPANPPLELGPGPKGKTLARAIELPAGRQPLFRMAAPKAAALGAVNTTPPKGGR